MYSFKNFSPEIEMAETHPNIEVMNHEINQQTTQDINAILAPSAVGVGSLKAGERIFKALRTQVCSSQKTGGSKSIRNRSRHSRRPRIIQHGGAMNDWANAAYVHLTHGASDGVLCFYQLIIFIDIVRVLNIADHFDSNQCKAIVGIIRTNLTNKNILSAYFQSFTPSDVKNLASGASAVGFIGYTMGPELVKGLSLIAQHVLLLPLQQGLVACAITIVNQISAVSFTGAVFVGICIHSFFHPSGTPLSLLPQDYYEIIDVEQAARALARYAGTTVKTAAINKFVQTKNFFRAIIEKVATGIQFMQWSVATAKHYYRTGIAATACNKLTADTLNLMATGPVTLDHLELLSNHLVTILHEIRDQIPELKDAVTNAFTAGHQCTEHDIRVASGLSRPPCQPGSNVLVKTAEHMAELAANQRAQLEAVAKQATTVFPRISLPPKTAPPSSPSSTSNQRPLKRPGSGWDVGGPLDVEQHSKKKGGSSKHKKKHPRSTNKRKLLVKRIRRRSMKHKKKCN